MNTYLPFEKYSMVCFIADYGQLGKAYNVHYYMPNSYTPFETKSFTDKKDFDNYVSTWEKYYNVVWDK